MDPWLMADIFAQARAAHGVELTQEAVSWLMAIPALLALLAVEKGFF